MSAIQCCPQLFGQPVTWSFKSLIETRQPVVDFLCQPAREAFRFRDSEFAEFCSTARYRAADEWRSLDGKPMIGQLARQRLRILVRYIHDEQVLHHRRAQIARAEALGELRGGL